MTKQEEIIRTPEQAEAHKAYLVSLKREEIREELAKERYYDGMTAVGSGIPQWEDRTEIEREYFRTKIDKDFQYLHSQDVAIKVEGELPVEITGDITLAGAELLTKEIKDLLPQLGYTAWEPLIKKGECQTKGVMIKTQGIKIDNTDSVEMVGCYLVPTFEPLIKEVKDGEA